MIGRGVGGAVSVVYDGEKERKESWWRGWWLEGSGGADDAAAAISLPQERGLLDYYKNPFLRGTCRLQVSKTATECVLVVSY